MSQISFALNRFETNKNGYKLTVKLQFVRKRRFKKINNKQYRYTKSSSLSNSLSDLSTLENFVLHLYDYFVEESYFRDI